MEPKTYIIELGPVYNNGVLCETPTVEVLGYNNLIKSCVDEVNNVYEVVSPGGAHQCITFAISCCDCDDCGTKVIEKCLCETSSQCNGCEGCIGGLCTPLCPEDYFCEADECVNCNPDNPCEGGKECVDGRCQCPDSAPIDKYGKCLECEFEGVENCKECIGGKLSPLPCAGVCDPATNGCVDCLTTSDCDGENECCKGTHCNCCTGYVRDTEGVCVPAPECIYEDDCGACEICNNGLCEKQKCPDGLICLGEYGCVPSCNCLGVDGCEDTTDHCINLYGDCGCVECKGDCKTGCDEGCYCDGYQCVADPCHNGKCPCTDGTDCPDGYGCDGFNCQPCNQPGITPSRCTSLMGCTHNGMRCVDSKDPCNDYTCVDCSSHPDCECSTKAEDGLMGLVVRRCRTAELVAEDCSQNITSIARTCSGVTCDPYPGATYTVNGQEMSDICTYVSGLAKTTSAIITATYQGCAPKQISLPALSCTSGLGISVDRVNDTQAILTITGDTNSQVSISQGSAGHSGATVTPAGNGKYLLDDLKAYESYTITAVKSDFSVTVDGTVPSARNAPNDCGLDGEFSSQIVAENCDLKMTSNTTNCNCEAYPLKVQITNASFVNGIHTIDYLTDVDSDQLDTGTLTITDDQNVDHPAQLSGTGTIVMDRAAINSRVDTITADYVLANDELQITLSDVPAHVSSITVNLAGQLDGQTNNTFPATYGWINVAKYQFTEVEYHVVFKDGYDAVTFTHVIDTRTTRTFVENHDIESSIPPSNTTVLTFKFTGITTKNDCLYTDITRVVTIEGSSVTGTNPYNTTLSPSTATTDVKRFLWKLNNVVVREAYASFSDTLPGVSGVVGSTYEGSVSCADCTETGTAILCCDPNVTVVMSGSSVTVNAAPITGVYELFFNGEIREVDTATVYNTVSAGTYLAWIQPKGKQNCRTYFVVKKV